MMFWPSWTLLVTVCCADVFRVPAALSLGAQILDDVRDILRLIDEGVAKVGRPVEILAHLVDDVGKARQSLHRRVVFGAVDRRVIVLRHGVRVAVEPTVNLDDLDRIGAGGQNLRQKTVGIKRDRREQLFELRPAETGLRRGRLRSVWLRGRRRRRRGAAGLSWASAITGAAASSAANERLIRRMPDFGSLSARIIFFLPLRWADCARGDSKAPSQLRSCRMTIMGQCCRRSTQRFDAYLVLGNPKTWATC